MRWLLLEVAVDWQVIDRMPCTIRLLLAPQTPAPFHVFEAFEQLVKAAPPAGWNAHLIALLGGEAGVRLGEMMAPERGDVDFKTSSITVQRSRWRGRTTVPKGGRVRHVTMTRRLGAALKESRHLRGPFVLCDDAGAPLSARS